MGLDIYKYLVKHHADDSMKFTQEDLDENKSFKDLFEKFKDFVKVEKEKYIDIIATQKKHNIPLDWEYTSMNFDDSDLYYITFENSTYTKSKDVYETDIVKVEKDVYVLYYTQLLYQRKQCIPSIYSDIFGTDNHELNNWYYSISAISDNTVLDCVKLYAEEGSDFSNWTLRDNEFVILDF